MARATGAARKRSNAGASSRGPGSRDTRRRNGPSNSSQPNSGGRRRGGSANANARDSGSSQRRPQRSTKRRAPQKKVTAEDLDAQLDKYMGDDAARNRLDNQLDAYFNRSSAAAASTAETTAVEGGKDAAMEE